MKFKKGKYTLENLAKKIWKDNGKKGYIVLTEGATACHDYIELHKPTILIVKDIKKIKKIIKHEKYDAEESNATITIEIVKKKLEIEIYLNEEDGQFVSSTIIYGLGKKEREKFKKKYGNPKNN